MRKECHFCVLKNNCSGYYEGCYEVVNGRNLNEVDEAINSVDKAIEDLGVKHLFSTTFKDFLTNT